MALHIKNEHRGFATIEQTKQKIPLRAGGWDNKKIPLQGGKRTGFRGYFT